MMCDVLAEAEETIEHRLCCAWGRWSRNSWASSN